MKQKKYEEYLKRTLPECEEIQCKLCDRKYWDDFNLICLGALDMCMLCANRNVDIPTTIKIVIPSLGINCLSINPP